MEEKLKQKKSYSLIKLELQRYWFLALGKYSLGNNSNLIIYVNDFLKGKSLEDLDKIVEESLKFIEKKCIEFLDESKINLTERQYSKLIIDLHNLYKKQLSLVKKIARREYRKAQENKVIREEHLKLKKDYSSIKSELRHYWFLTLEESSLSNNTINLIIYIDEFLKDKSLNIFEKKVQESLKFIEKKCIEVLDERKINLTERQYSKLIKDLHNLYKKQQSLVKKIARREYRKAQKHQDNDFWSWHINSDAFTIIVSVLTILILGLLIGSSVDNLVIILLAALIIISIVVAVCLYQYSVDKIPNFLKQISELEKVEIDDSLKEEARIILESQKIKIFIFISLAISFLTTIILFIYIAQKFYM